MRNVGETLRYPHVREENQEPFSSKSGRQRKQDSLVTGIYLMFAFYAAIPILELPLLGLSLSAPLFFPVFLAAFLHPPENWFYTYRRWIFLAVSIWVGVFCATAGNIFIVAGENAKLEDLLGVCRYGYWLLVFITTVYFVTRTEIASLLVKTLGPAIFFTSLLLWSEVIVGGRIGAWTNAGFLTQNSYGILFSIFSPFILVPLTIKGEKNSLITMVIILSVWSAAIINGSRGSWIAILAGILTFLFINWLAKSRPSGLLMRVLLLSGFLLAMVFFSPYDLFSTVPERGATFRELSDDKSFAIRGLMNQKAIMLFQASPLLGVGTGRSGKSSVPLEVPEVLRYAPQAYFEIKSPHNSYLAFLSEHGLAAAMPFSLLLLILTTQGLKAAVDLTRRGQAWAAGVYASFVAMSVHMWVIASLTNSATWLIYGLVGATIVTSRAQRRGI